MSFEIIHDKYHPYSGKKASNLSARSNKEKVQPTIVVTDANQLRALKKQLNLYDWS